MTMRTMSALAVLSCWFRQAGAEPVAPDPEMLCETVDGEEVCAPEVSDGPGREHMLLSHRIAKSKAEGDASAAGCTAENEDPFGSGSFRECCGGLERKLGNWDGAWRYKCIPAAGYAAGAPASPAKCTPEGSDPWRTGSFVDCCGGLVKELSSWHGSSLSYQCRPSSGAEGTQSVQSTQSTGSAASFKVLQWNVYYQNQDLAAIAKTIAANNPVADVIGLCEFTASASEMASALSAATGRRYEVQPGRNGWKGYGTDIFFDAGKWRALEGGAATVQCKSVGGQRAANWAVLQERVSGKVLITGGVHLSFCRDGCDPLHECELWQLYEHLQAMKQKHRNAPVVWMGDLNRAVHDRVVKNAMKGRIGSRTTFHVSDVSRAGSSTHMNGGSAIDHIFAERQGIQVKHGGLTGQGVLGRRLVGADHFPIYAALILA